MKSKSIGFIGGGRITRILLNGFKNADVSFGIISVYETNETVLNALKADYPQIETSGTDSSRAASSALGFHRTSSACIDRNVNCN